MDTVRDGRRRSKVREAEGYGSRYARYLREEPDWQRFLRHHTAIGESGADTLATAEEAVAGLTGPTSAADREELILRALRYKRAERVRRVASEHHIRPLTWEASDRYAYLHNPCINGA